MRPPPYPLVHGVPVQPRPKFLSQCQIYPPKKLGIFNTKENRHSHGLRDVTVGRENLVQKRKDQWSRVPSNASRTNPISLSATVPRCVAAIGHRQHFGVSRLLPVVLSQKPVQDHRLLRHQMRSHAHRIEAERRRNSRSDIGPDRRPGAARLMHFKHALVGTAIQIILCALRCVVFWFR